MANLNSVETTVTIAGKACHFVHLTLNQSFNSHHTFEIKVDYSELDIRWMANPIKMFQMIGEDVNITMQHKQTGEMNLFNGIITNVAMSGQHGENNHIIVSGCSPTIKLDGEPTMDSFVDLTLENIVQESIDNSGNGGEVDIKPKFKGKIDFLIQHNETCFEFLNRLSWLYGDWLGYDGTSTFFGKPDLEDASSITYDAEMTHFDLSASLIPPNVNRFDYLTHDVNEVNSTTPDRVDGVRGYIKVSLDQSKKVYTSEATRPLEASILSKKEIDDLVKVDKYRKVSQMLTMKGRTQTCKVRIAKLISVGLPSNMEVDLKHVETFLVTQVTHEADQDGTYFNTFTAIPSEMENIPMTPVKAPVALPQIAWVKSNADGRGRGRVKVEFQWQKKINKTTNWIRVATPDAGSSISIGTNRGFVFIPEEGDQVMVNFENGDPNRPYVSSSIFAENVGGGGGNNNHTKSIYTRSGHRIVFDDDESTQSILIKDINDNIIKLSTKDKTITIESEDTITLRSKNINMYADDILVSAQKSININAQEDININAEQEMYVFGTKKLLLHSNDHVDIESFDILYVQAKEAYYKGSELFEVSGKIVNVGAMKNMLISALEMTINGEQKIEIKAPSINEIPSPDTFPFKEKVVKFEFNDDL